MNPEARRAVEALRAGVPNAEAVRFLGAGQDAIVDRFQGALDALGDRAGAASPNGFILRGEFGSGKSHVLHRLLQIAKSSGFATSFVVAGKETPLSDLDLVYKAAVKELALEDRQFGDLGEIADKLKASKDASLAFVESVQAMTSLDPIFAASVRVWDRLQSNDELREQIQTFWAGGRINVTVLKRELKRLSRDVQALKAPKASSIAAQRFAFGSAMMRAAGYRGWVILVDEVEQLALLSMRSRARAYAELVWLLGYQPVTIPGVVVVAAATSEFTGEVFQRKRDDVKIPLSAWALKDPAAVERAIQALRVIDERSGAWQAVLSQSEGDLDRAYGEIRELYRRAFDWESSETKRPVYRDVGRRMRMHVREWITRWDLERLDPSYVADIASEAVQPDLREREGLEGFSDADEGGDEFATSASGAS